MIKSQKHVHVDDDNFMITFCGANRCIGVIDIVFRICNQYKFRAIMVWLTEVTLVAVIELRK